jgi:ribosomal protein S18 acetylase RimI-like enzyme
VVHNAPVVTTRAIRRDQLDDWISVGVDDPANERMGDRVRGAWADGSGGPSLTFVAQDDGGAPVGRLAFTHGAVAEALPERHEALAIGMWLAWEDPGSVDVGRRLIVDHLGALPASVIALDGYANPEYMVGAAGRRAVFEAAGMPLFQEKEGFLWTPSTSPAPPHARLTFRGIAEVGRELYAATMSRCIDDTLDRQDRYYAALTGRDGWGPEMLGFLTDEDAPTWLLGFDPDDAIVGYMALGAFDEAGRGTIMHIGVMPEHRGRGYIDDLLAACNAAALRRGFDRVLSDVDILNGPMRAAMERAGHLSAATPWHVHHYRLELGDRG